VEVWALVISIVSVFISTVAIAFAYLQWRAAVRQADIAERVAKDQALDVERARKAAEASAEAAKELADTASRQYRLRFMPSIEVTYTGRRLNIHNKGRENIWLWGTKVSGFPLGLESQGRLIVPNGFYYILGDGLEAAFAEIRKDGKEVRVTCQMFLQTADEVRYVASMSLWATFSDPQTEIHTQMLDIQPIENWPSK
jgi:hypothetical protein